MQDLKDTGAGRGPVEPLPAGAARRRAGHAPEQPRLRAAGARRWAGCPGRPRSSTAARPTAATWTCCSATPRRRSASDWLMPLLEGRIRSAFAMSEPDVASSDPTNLQTAVRREGGQLVINGRKWFITGAAHPELPAADRDVPQRRRRRQATRGTAATAWCWCRWTRPACSVVRNIPIMQHTSPEGHCEILLRDVRVPAENLLGELGRGLRDGAGAPRARARAPLHAHHRPVRAGAGAGLRPRAGAAGLRQVPRRPVQRAGLDRASRAWRSTRPGCWCCTPRGAWTRPQPPQQLRAAGRRHQGGRRAAADPRGRPRDADLRRHGPVARHAAGVPVDLGPGAAPPGRPRRGPPAHRGAAGTGARAASGAALRRPTSPRPSSSRRRRASAEASRVRPRRAGASSRAPIAARAGASSSAAAAG